VRLKFSFIFSAHALDSRRYVVSETELATRTLNIAVWHEKVGVNVFLGEVNLSGNALDLSKPVKTKEYELLCKVSVRKCLFCFA